MLVNPAHGIIENLFSNTADLLRSIVPIHVVKQNKDIVFEGSSIYLKIDARHFLVTANHIAEKAQVLRVQIDEENIGAVPTDLFHGRGDPADIAVAELHEPLRMYSPVNATECSSLRKVPRTGVLVALGFPQSRVKASSRESVVSLYGFGTYEEPVSAYLEHNRDRSQHIVMHFDQENMMDKRASLVTTPKPVGLSGGGVFWLPDAGKYGPSEPRLVGILTEYIAGQKLRFFATQLTVVQTMLREHYGLEMGI